MGPANRHGHPSDSHRKGVSSERSLVQRLNNDALVESEMLEAACLAGFQLGPVHVLNARRATDLQLVQWKGERRRVSNSRHVAIDYQ